jgi:hypothetical protein
MKHSYRAPTVHVTDDSAAMDKLEANITGRDLGRALMLGLVVTFDYDGKTRKVEPHAVGKSTKDGSYIMRGYQIGGLASRTLPAWTLFTVSGISNLQLTFDKSNAPREGYSQGDKQMDPVIIELAL